MDFSAVKNIMDGLTSWKVPGNSISICIDNKEVFSYQSGYSDYENKIPMGKDALFNIYSCSKVVTVVAALQLYEKGLFSLDAPLYDFIPEYKNMCIKDADGNISEAKKYITLRHLFTMTSGMTYDCDTLAFKKARELTDGKMDTVTVAKCLAQDPLTFEPGEKWVYSLAHDVLAAVVEVVSGKKFRDYVRENIFLPLGMNNSYYHNELVRDKMSQQYRFQVFNEQDIANLKNGFKNSFAEGLSNVGKELGYAFGSEYDSGGAGITTSVPDYSRFASALANGGIGATGEKILDPKTITLLHTDQLSEQLHIDYDNDVLKGYGYGLGVKTMIDVAKSGGYGNLGEFGWGGAAGASTFINPELKLSMFYAQHVLNPQDEYYQRDVRNAVYQSLK